MSQPSVSPFDKLFSKEPAKNKLVTRRVLWRLLRSIFGAFNVSGTGVKLSMHEEGRLHLELDGFGEGACTHAFKLSTSSTGVLVSPGVVAISGLPRTPKIGSRLISDTESVLGPPVLIPPQGTGYIWIETIARPSFASLNVGGVTLTYLEKSIWPTANAAPIVGASIALPVDEPAQLNFETGAYSDGKYYIILGRFSRAGQSISILDQGWITNVNLSITGTGYVSKSAW